MTSRKAIAYSVRLEQYPKSVRRYLADAENGKQGDSAPAKLQQSARDSVHHRRQRWSRILPGTGPNTTLIRMNESIPWGGGGHGTGGGYGIITTSSAGKLTYQHIWNNGNAGIGTVMETWSLTEAIHVQPRIDPPNTHTHTHPLSLLASQKNNP